MIPSSNKIELHYYLSNDSHSMNAAIRNECERELLQIVKELTSLFGEEFEIESEAFQTGGLRNIWKALGKNSAQITLILAVITVILSRVPLENKELTKLQIENLTLENEIKKRELDKIKKEAKSDSAITDEIVDKVIKALESDYKINWHKSNFYKKVNSYKKIDGISTTLLNEDNEPTNDERKVLRSEFMRFIIHSDSFPPLIDKQAVIAIISPVLTKGNFQWRGSYNGQIIFFEMKDKDFRNSVLNKKIEFVNGIAIKCVLQQNRKIDENGIIQVVSTQVLTVLDIIENDQSSETPQGKKYRKNQSDQERQTKLF